MFCTGIFLKIEECEVSVVVIHGHTETHYDAFWFHFREYLFCMPHYMRKLNKLQSYLLFLLVRGDYMNKGATHWHNTQIRW